MRLVEGCVRIPSTTALLHAHKPRRAACGGGLRGTIFGSGHKGLLRADLAYLNCIRLGYGDTRQLKFCSKLCNILVRSHVLVLKKSALDQIFIFFSETLTYSLSLTARRVGRNFPLTTSI